MLFLHTCTTGVVSSYVHTDVVSSHMHTDVISSYMHTDVVSSHMHTDVVSSDMHTDVVCCQCHRVHTVMLQTCSRATRWQSCGGRRLMWSLVSSCRTRSTSEMTAKYKECSEAETQLGQIEGRLGESHSTSSVMS